MIIYLENFPLESSDLILRYRNISFHNLKFNFKAKPILQKQNKKSTSFHESVETTVVKG